MRNNPLVSIIIPVYNVEPYLHDALDSVIHQTYSNLEIIIIDDGSTDKSGKICDDFGKKDKRIHVIHQENKGLSTARNVGLDIITGKFVAFLDPDDAFDPEFIKKLVFATIQNHTDLALCKYTVHNTTNKLIRNKKEIPTPRIQSGIYDRVSMLQSLSDDTINTAVWNKLYNRELWDNIRFPEGHVFEDGEIAYKIINQIKAAVVLNLPLYLHRKRAESITEALSWRILCDKILGASRVKTYIADNLIDVIPKETLYNAEIKYLNTLMTVYAKIPMVKDKIDKKVEMNKLRKQIIQTSKEINIKNWPFRTRTAFFMIRFCPFLFRISYPIYSYIKLLMRKIIRI